MFDTISGLPMHPLLVHAVVVLLPLMCLVTIVTAFYAPMRRFAVPVIVLNVLVFLASFAAKESGEALYHRVTSFSPANADLQEHIRWGDKLPILALGMVVVSVIVWYVSTRRPSLTRWAGVLAVLGALVTVGVTVWVGDTGARAVWATVISSTNTK